MLARVRDDCPWSVVTAFGGEHYGRDEWRKVPAGAEAEAGAHPLLDTMEVTPEPDNDNAPAVAPAAKPRPRKRTPRKRS